MFVLQFADHLSRSRRPLVVHGADFENHRVSVTIRSKAGPKKCFQNAVNTILNEMKFNFCYLGPFFQNKIW
jgi:hypothetical protein